MSSARAFVPRPLRQGVVTQKVDGETLLYVERTHQASCLNAPAARIWALCDGERTVGAIAAGAGLEPEVVAHALGHFANAGLLENTPNQERPSLSRRRVLMGVGLAAIPIVLMVMAPEARAAASNCIKPMQPCTDASLCCSGECVLGLCG
jgi:hypothetical protein